MICLEEDYGLEEHMPISAIGARAHLIGLVQVKSSQVYTPQYAKSTRQKSNARALLAQVKCLSTSGPKSRFATLNRSPCVLLGKVLSKYVPLGVVGWRLELIGSGAKKDHRTGQKSVIEQVALCERLKRGDPPGSS